jgi:hypothetical protein
MCARLRCDRLDELLVAACEQDLVTGPARQFDNGCANPLTASGDEKTGWLHGRDSSLCMVIDER